MPQHQTEQIQSRHPTSPYQFKMGDNKVHMIPKQILHNNQFYFLTKINKQQKVEADFYTYAFLSFVSLHQLNHDFEAPLNPEILKTRLHHALSCTEVCGFLHH